MEKTRSDQLREACQAYHRAHPEVWVLFCQYAWQAIRSGRAHYSAKAIFERIRWHVEIDGAGDPAVEFRLNNNFPALYARRFMRLHPEAAGFFRTRKRISESMPAVSGPELSPSDFPTYPNQDRSIA